MNRVLISDRLSEQAVGIFSGRGIEVDFDPGLASDVLMERIADYDGLAVRSATKVTASVIEAGDKLKVIGRAGIGVDNIDVDAASARGVVVMNTPFGNAVTTAEHAIALMFALARKIPAADRETQGGAWNRSKFVGTELTGKTLGIVGCGNVGSAVAERALGLKMKVLVYDPFLPAERAERLRIAKVELDDLLAGADVISLHTPLTDRTRGIVDAAAIARTKPGVRFVNCARGELVDADALAEAVSSGHVAGVAIDVYPDEPPGDYPLFGMEGVIATPHLGASTAEAQENVAVQIAEQMSDYLLDGAVLHAVNMPSLSSEESARLAPFMELGRQIGSLAGQVAETGFRAVVVEYEGEAAELNRRPMTAALLEGLLAPIVDSINIVNAPIVARERGIQVTETKHERKTDYPIAENMKNIAQVMFADVGTRVFYTQHGSFDTHANELASHGKLWNEVSTAVADFMDDLKEHGKDKDTVILLFSEFGRRINDNGAGTDHGSGGVAFVIGGDINGGLYADFPSLRPEDQLEGDMHFSNDFRLTYSTILDRWLGVDPEPITNGNFEQFDFIRN